MKESVTEECQRKEKKRHFRVNSNTTDILSLVGVFSINPFSSFSKGV